jgi:hypothetical protein
LLGIGGIDTIAAAVASFRPAGGVLGPVTVGSDGLPPIP